eukprot:CAMPEP_0178535842 /NCGR_PEP_ID=MMETSP0696-20121128/35763_1 /TAXON_ID=265572 /ORGANISM="Extubocellulus spinifer, Strain CCMP396" /LENGTH=511 /DNA_ID=CAMNT_0020168013 /DNA_START=25 /DNA_END=1560 /DNA_ORIENTATION=-
MGRGGDSKTPTRSVRAENVYGPFPANTLKPWKNSRNEGREGDVVDMPKENAAEEAVVEIPVDYRDAKTPDDWIPRDGRMVRLTGRHPFNSEPPVKDLVTIPKGRSNCFLTPANLQITRNHGSVPKLSWDTHRLSIEGPLVDSPVSLSMDALTTNYPTTEFPVTISCCGNRRKEMNMIKQTIGFNWGIGACGTMVYKGVLLRDLLASVGVDHESVADITGTHVEFIGNEDLGNKCGGPAKCLDPAEEVMVAFQANGAPLHPDRGYPIRLVIPGYIGGRMVKWLTRIRVIPHESHSCYHYWDNKYLPPQVTAEMAASEGWWYKQEYIINELALNSFICKPNHNDTVPLAANLDKTTCVSGYAHSGGGRMVTRVELSTDHGATWDLTDITRHEQPNPYGKYWCWIWWKYDLPLVKLLQDGNNLASGEDLEIWVRAWDTSNSPQPEKPTWTLMGQSSNHIFRVKVHTETSAATGKVVYRFEHPTQPGQQTGGWATRIAAKVKSAGYGEINMASYK